MDTKCHWEEEAHQHNTALSSTNISRQHSLDSHLVPTDAIIQYSDSTFHNAAIEWLVAIDQVSNFTNGNYCNSLMNNAIAYLLYEASNVSKIAQHCLMCSQQDQISDHIMVCKFIIKKFKVNLLLLKKKLLVCTHTLMHYWTNVVQ